MKDSPESSCPDTLNKAVSLVPYAGQYLNPICYPFVLYALSLWIQCFCLPSESMQSRIGYGRKLTILQSDPALTDLDVYMPFLMVQELHFKREFSSEHSYYLNPMLLIGESSARLLRALNALAQK